MTYVATDKLLHSETQNRFWPISWQHCTLKTRQGQGVIGSDYLEQDDYLSELEFKSIYLQRPTLPQLRLNLQRAVADIMAQWKRVVTKTQLGPTWLVGVDNISQLVRYYCCPSVWVMGTPQRHTHTHTHQLARNATSSDMHLVYNW